MKEKIFLFLFLILISLVTINSSLANSFLFPHKFLNSGSLNEDSKYPPYIKGIYLTSWTAGNSQKIDYIINLIKHTELNAVVIDIKEVDGRIVFDTESKLINELKTERILISNPKKLIEKLHKENIYTIARIVVFKDMALPKNMLGVALKNRGGELWRDWAGWTWLDPASKDVWDYHIELAKEAIKIGFDEINFDYVRFPSDGDISRIVFPAWDGRASRAEVIREFFKYIDKELRPFNTFLSVDLFGLTLWHDNNNDMNIGQILEYTAPYFDFICPMVYPSHYPEGFNGYKNPAAYPYEIIKANLLKGGERIKGERAKLRPWLQDFDIGANYDKEMIEAQKQAVYDTNSYGWLLWNPSSRYTEEALEIRK